MADVGKVKAEENQNKENDKDTESESEAEDTEKDKKSSGDKNKKKNAASAPAKIKPPAKKRVKVEQAEESKKEKEKDTKKKKAAVKVKEEEEEEEDDEADGSDEGSEGEENGVPDKVPLLDQPLEISGSRERKQVERFIPKETKSDAVKKVEIPDGKGKLLSNIPRIQYQISKLKPDGLKVLHKVLFNRVGQPTAIKKNVGLFKGFEFEKDSSDYQKKLSTLVKLKNADLKELCTILDLTKTGKHAELADKILQFLIVPEDSGKAAPDPRPKRKGIKSKSYKEADGEGKEDSKKGKSKPASGNKKTKASSEDEEQPEEAEDEEEEESEDKKTEDEEEDNESVASEEDKPKKATKQPRPKKNAPAAKKGTGASSNSNKKGKEKSESETENQSDAEESTKEPPEKKSKSPPTDDEIKLYVKSVLEGANLEEITMKTVCKKVYEHYPEFDLGYKKEFIKNTVKSLISS